MQGNCQLSCLIVIAGYERTGRADSWENVLLQVDMDFSVKKKKNVERSAPHRQTRPVCRLVTVFKFARALPETVFPVSQRMRRTSATRIEELGALPKVPLHLMSSNRAREQCSDAVTAPKPPRPGRTAGCSCTPKRVCRPKVRILHGVSLGAVHPLLEEGYRPAIDQ